MIMTPSSADDDRTRGTGDNGGVGTAVCVVAGVAAEAEVAESNVSGPNTRIVVLTFVVLEASFAIVLGAARSESRC